MSTHQSENIIDWKSRRGPGGSNYNASVELTILEQAWSKNSETLGAFKDFVPIRLVTLIEVFVRDIVRETVDRGPPYLELAEKLVKGTKIDFLFAQNIQGKRISIGDIVAHSISTNSITHIVSAFETLFPKFKEGITKIHDRVEVEIYGKPKKPIVGDIERLLECLANLFEARHIVTHEMPIDPPYDSSDLSEFIRSTREFIDATDWYVRSQLDGEMPLTQTDMNIQAGNSLDEAERKLQEIVAQVEKLEDMDLELLNLSQHKWNEFIAAEAKLQASSVEGGSMYPMIYAASKETLVRDRIAELQRWISREKEYDI